jgi:prophage regulatory protein
MERLLSKRQVKELVTYSFAHTARLEADGKFPKRVRLGTGRVAYVEREVSDWIASRIAERDATNGS